MPLLSLRKILPLQIDAKNIGWDVFQPNYSMYFGLLIRIIVHDCDFQGHHPMTFHLYLQVSTVFQDP